MQKTKKVANEVTATIIKPQGMPVHGMAGLMILFVAISIGYANYIVYFGTHDIVSKIMLIPSTIFVAAFLLYKAVK